jgi:hypothetical protein
VYGPVKEPVARLEETVGLIDMENYPIFETVQACQLGNKLQRPLLVP